MTYIVSLSKLVAYHQVSFSRVFSPSGSRRDGISQWDAWNAILTQSPTSVVAWWLREVYPLVSAQEPKQPWLLHGFVVACQTQRLTLAKMIEGVAKHSPEGKLPSLAYRKALRLTCHKALEIKVSGGVNRTSVQASRARAQPWIIIIKYLISHEALDNLVYLTHAWKVCLLHGVVDLALVLLNKNSRLPLTWAFSASSKEPGTYPLFDIWSREHSTIIYLWAEFQTPDQVRRHDIMMLIRHLIMTPTELMIRSDFVFDHQRQRLDAQYQQELCCRAIARLDPAPSEQEQQQIEGWRDYRHQARQTFKDS
jgi:hypothetical protein